jgi:hypothetical protein
LSQFFKFGCFLGSVFVRHSFDLMGLLIARSPR